MSTIVTGLMPEPKIQFFDNTGKPLVGGLLYTYHPGQPGVFKATYKSATAGDDYNTNPIVLDGGGRASVWLDGYYDMELRSSTGTTIWTQSNVSSFPYDSLAYITSVVKDNETNINLVAGSIDEVNIVADNLSDVTNFAGVYYGPSATDPTTRANGDALEDGDLYFNTVDNGLKAYANGVWYTTDTLGATDAQLVVYTPSGTGVIESTVQTELRKSFRTSNYSTFAQAVTAATGYTLIVDSNVSIADDTTVTVSMTHELPGKFTIASGKTLTINGPFQCGLFQCFDGAGTVTFGSGSVTEVYPEWFQENTTPGTTDMGEAIRDAVVSITTAGGVVKFSSNTYAIDSSESSAAINIINSNIHLIGNGLSSVVKYIGATKIDYLVRCTDTATENIVIKDLKLVGGEYLQGNVKWVFYAKYFPRNCVLDNVVIREGLGLLKLVTAYYGSMKDVQLIQTVPDPADQGWSLADWQEVYSSTSAPVYIGGVGGACYMSRVSLSKVGSEAHTGNTGANIMLFNTDIQADSLSIETSGTPYNTYAVSTQFTVRVTDCRVALDNLYLELVGGITACLYIVGRAGLVLNSPFVYNYIGSDISAFVNNDANHDFVARDGEFYNIDAKRMNRQSVTNGGVNGTLVYENCIVATGKRSTDATINAYTNNLYDTYSSLYKLGLEDSLTRTVPRKSRFPERSSGFTVTNSTDANGAYVQVEAGIFVSEREKIASTKVPVQGSNSTFVKYRLRPTTASKYYRVYVGVAGNLYLVESASAFTDDTGDWLASFSTDASIAISGLTANGRLGVRGIYLNDRAVSSNTVAPSSGNWIQGDRVLNATPTVGQPKGWICTVSGSPGTWVSEGNL